MKEPIIITDEYMEEVGADLLEDLDRLVNPETWQSSEKTFGFIFLTYPFGAPDLDGGYNFLLSNGATPQEIISLLKAFTAELELIEQLGADTGTKQ